MISTDHRRRERHHVAFLRSLPSVSVSSLRTVEKVLASGAVILDLEDAVALDAEAEASRDVVRGPEAKGTGVETRIENAGGLAGIDGQMADAASVGTSSNGRGGPLYHDGRGARGAAPEGAEQAGLTVAPGQAMREEE